MKEQYIKTIRKACIKANPEIKEKHREVNGIADVLLAIKLKGDGLTPVILGDIFWEEESSVTWNLLKTLEDQDEPTLKFISELLTNNK